MNTAVALLVDADASVHEAVAGALGEECAFVGARGLDAAVKLSERRPPAVLILDDVPGYEQILEGVRQHAPNVRVVFLTTSRDPARLSQLAGLGPVLTKPIELDRLRVSVRNMVRLGAMASGVERMRTGQFPALGGGGTRKP